jgi:hypothetical protein
MLEFAVGRKDFFVMESADSTEWRRDKGFAEAVEGFRLLWSGGRMEAGFGGRVLGRTVPSRFHGGFLPALQCREEIGFLGETGGIIAQAYWLVQAESACGGVAGSRCCGSRFEVGELGSRCCSSMFEVRG